MNEPNVPFYDAHLPRTGSEAVNPVTYSLSGERRVQVFEVEGTKNLVIRITSPTLDGKTSVLLFAIGPEAAAALAAGIEFQLAKGEHRPSR